MTKKVFICCLKKKLYLEKYNSYFMIVCVHFCDTRTQFCIMTQALQPHVPTYKTLINHKELVFLLRVSVRVGLCLQLV